MLRRLLLTALACWPVQHVLAQEATRGPRHQISAGSLHAMLARRFPLRLGMGAWIELVVSAPQLHLRPSRNQLGATLHAQLGGLQVPQRQEGEVDVVFALRYEAADRSVRAHRMEILALRSPHLPPEQAQLMQQWLPLLARDATGEVVLHRFTPAELALADTMGFEPATIEVLHDGLAIQFAPKRGAVGRPPPG